MTFQTRCRPVTVVPALMALLLLVLGGAPAAAQFMNAGLDFGGMTRVSRRSVQAYGTLVGMDAPQTEAALALHEGYAESHKALTKKFQDDMQKLQEEFQDTQDFSLFQKKMPKMAMEFQTQLDAVEDGFLGDLRALLTPAQDAQWPRVERMRRRESSMRVSMVSGQAADLVDILSDLKVNVSDNPDLADQLERYELDLDKHLAALERWGKEQQDEWMEGEDAFDMSKMQEMMERAEKTMKEMSDMAKDVRDVNRQYARTITPLLPADQQEKFDHEVKRRSFPRVYRTPWVSKAITAASGFADLSEQQKADLAEMSGAYARDLAAANARWAAAIESREEQTGGTILAMMQMQQGKDEGADEVSAARTGRRELDQRYKDRLSALLTDEQEGRLPEEKRRAQDQDFMGMMAVSDLEGEEEHDEGEDDPG